MIAQEVGETESRDHEEQNFNTEKHFDRMDNNDGEKQLTASLGRVCQMKAVANVEHFSGADGNIQGRSETERD